ncbi:hypothetical protein R3P38DRAFT_2785832 [Favolaschia claudopus]|uniref:Uncharacterized protein n=1 Tax=Favolaschia claudopus TaxID=2862362 RepID=A0AAW0AUK8_9AGAR
MQRRHAHLANFFTKKAPPVPSTVRAPPPVGPSHLLLSNPNQKSGPINIPTSSSLARPTPSALARSDISDSAQRLTDLITQLREGARHLPPSPEADASNPLSIFSAEPASYVPANADPRDLWELLSSTFHKAFDYGGSAESRERMIQPGLLEIEGFCRFLEYFVGRGVEGGVVELKAEQLLSALNSVMPLTPEAQQKCAGFIFPCGSDYPWGLHDKITFPWSVHLDRGVITLRSHACAGQPASLSSETSMEGILDRAERGIPATANYAYYGVAGLTELLRRKNQQLQELRLKGMNTARKLLVQARSLSDYKRLVRAIGSGVVQNGRGVRGVLRLHDEAARGVYHPKDYTEEDDLRGILNWKMGGNRLADFAHRALGLPNDIAESTDRIPQVGEVAQNVEACFKGLKDALTDRKAVHAILMFDDIL